MPGYHYGKPNKPAQEVQISPNKVKEARISLPKKFK